MGNMYHTKYRVHNYASSETQKRSLHTLIHETKL